MHENVSRKNYKELGYLTATQVAAELNTSVITLTRWYDWYAISENKDCPKLPPYIRENDNDNSRRYWRSEDIPQLIKFKRWIPYGFGRQMIQDIQNFNRK